MSSLSNYQQELQTELQNILTYWTKFTPDNHQGGFIGKIDNGNTADYSAPKGSVLNARILWSFSAAYNLKAQTEYLQIAERAYEYIKRYFIDKEHGGVYWTVTHKGQSLDTKKQVYAIAFTIYALSEYFIATQSSEAQELAIQLYHQLEEKAFDQGTTGYFEAFTKTWEEIADLRLSEKDANEKKTMNTHLHVLEAYTTLYKIWENEGLKQQIILLINNFLDHIINTENGHLLLFFDENWNAKSDTVSYGHDIEAAWLLLEAAEVIGEEDLIATIKQVAIKMADAAAAGLDADGSMFYEYEPGHNHLIKEKHWWVQAEAMVGFYNAWELSGDETYLEKSLKIWAFTKKHIIDQQNGEWFWGVLEDGSLMDNQDKVGLWKCPYHNSRACMELIKRINKLT